MGRLRQGHGEGPGQGGVTFSRVVWISSKQTTWEPFLGPLQVQTESRTAHSSTSLLVSKKRVRG